MMVQIDTEKDGVILLSMDSIRKVSAHPDRADDEDDGMAVIETDDGKTMILKQSMVSFKRALEGGGAKIIRG